MCPINKQEQGLLCTVIGGLRACTLSLSSPQERHLHESKHRWGLGAEYREDKGWHCKSTAEGHEGYAAERSPRTESMIQTFKKKEDSKQETHRFSISFLLYPILFLQASKKKAQRSVWCADKPRWDLSRFSMFPCCLYCMYCSMTGTLQDDPMPDIVSGGWLYSMHIELRMAIMHTARVLWVLTLKEN